MSLGLSAQAQAGPDLSTTEEPPPSSHHRLHMSHAIACATIDGFRQYEPLPEPALTRDEKLLLYYEPEDFAIAKAGEAYRVHLTQDAQIRRKGQKSVLWTKSHILDSALEAPEPPGRLYLYNKISLKDLKPGDYDLDIVLHDKVGKGAPAHQTLSFKIKPSTEPAESEQAPEPREGHASRDHR